MLLLMVMMVLMMGGDDGNNEDVSVVIVVAKIPPAHTLVLLHMAAHVSRLLIGDVGRMCYDRVY